MLNQSVAKPCPPIGLSRLISASSTGLKHGWQWFLETEVRVDQLLRLRHRYLYTRKNRIRLRYVTSVALTLGAIGVLTASPFAGEWFPRAQNKTNQAQNLTQESFAYLAGALFDESKNLQPPEPVIPEAQRVNAGFISSGASLQKAAFAFKKPEKPPVYEVSLKSGDTIDQILRSAGLDNKQAYFVTQAMAKHYDPRHIKVGQDMKVSFRRDENGEKEFDSATLKLDAIRSVTVENTDDGYQSSLDQKEVIKQNFAKRVQIETSLYGSAARQNIPSQVIAELIRIYSWDVDFQRDIRRGDTLEVLYDIKQTKEGEFAGYGDISYARLSTGGVAKPVYRYEMKDGRIDYFDPKGQSIKKTLMKTPVDGARLSSGFGMRRHPVLGYNKMHKGIDFAAPTGTPIYAAGDGMIDYAGRKGGYGNYIRIRHNSNLKTAYAHMHKFAKGISTGKRVSQGEVIGYIGTTGRSTGPHLHYEVLVNNTQVSPNRVDLPVGEKLAGEELQKFKALRGMTSQEFANIMGEDYEVAAHNQVPAVKPDIF